MKKALTKTHRASLFVLLGMMSVGCGNKSTSFSLPSTSQNFTQKVTYNNKVDILFVVDNSKSMLQYQQRLSAKVPDLVNTLNSLKMDYQVAVTTTTMATDKQTYPMTRQILGDPKFLTSQNIQLLAQRLIVGESGSDNERGLDSLAYVTGSYAATFVPGFLRSDALFVVIFLGDENDNSTEFGNGDSSDFINYMNRLKPPFKEGGQAWIANYIGTIQNISCDILGGYVSVGKNYIRLVDASHGVKESICNPDLSAAVADIKARFIDQLTAYRLKEAPNKDSIVVKVDGVLISQDSVNGWTLETEIDTVTGGTNYLIRFHGTAIPAADQGIQVEFTPAGAN